MDSFIDIAWIIPIAPLFGSLFVGLLLFSFSRTMNRLTKPVSFLLITCIGISTLFSVFFYLKNLSGEVFSWHVHLWQINLDTTFYLNSVSELLSILIGSIFFFIALFSYYRLPRSKGYVSYISLLSFICGIGFLLSLDRELISKFIT